MSFWIHLWSIFFFLSLGIFMILAIVVTIGGVFNIRALFADLLAHASNPTDGITSGQNSENG